MTHHVLRALRIRANFKLARAVRALAGETPDFGGGEVLADLLFLSVEADALGEVGGAGEADGGEG